MPKAMFYLLRGDYRGMGLPNMGRLWGFLNERISGVRTARLKLELGESSGVGLCLLL